MKIAITGHTAGIGQAFATYLTDRGHDIVGISQRNGFNIKDIDHVTKIITECDMFINNAQSGFAQTELLLQVANHWQDDNTKMIWNIGTAMTESYNLPTVDNHSTGAIIAYRVQKRALEDACKTLKAQDNKVRIVTIRPGAVATQPYNIANENAADVNQWVHAVCNFYIECRKHKLFPSDFSITFKKQAPDI